ncbi:MAG: S46 family peptidase, partial [Bacteroidales bacterium]|nr:S46 family peptidase [Bacteroidales bacterium]
MNYYKLLLTILLTAVTGLVRADGGMWLPILAEQRIADMQKNGFKLTAEDIYSVNKACMKDAVMIFGGGCTAELVSNQGLILTNHHCGRSYIQGHSTLDNDILTNGFWAK